MSELCLIGKPAIFVPSPNVAEDHQTKNALALVEKDAALLVRDGEAVSRLFPVVEALLADPERMRRMAANIRVLPNGSLTRSWRWCLRNKKTIFKGLNGFAYENVDGRLCGDPVFCSLP